MAGATYAPASRARLWLLAAALLVQGGWVWLLRMERAAPHVGSTVTEIRLLPLKQPPSSQQRDPQPVPIRVRPVFSPHVPEVPVISDPTLEGRPAIDNTNPSPSPASPSTTPALITIAPAPLRLSLPPRAASSPRNESVMDMVRNDPRSHSEPRTLEHRLADAAGTLPVTVQSSTSGSGSTVIRQGTKCTRVTENRMKALNPTDERLKDAPSVAGDCYR